MPVFPGQLRSSPSKPRFRHLQQVRLLRLPVAPPFLERLKKDFIFKMLEFSYAFHANCGALLEEHFLLAARWSESCWFDPHFPFPSGLGLYQPAKIINFWKKWRNIFYCRMINLLIAFFSRAKFADLLICLNRFADICRRRMLNCVLKIRMSIKLKFVKNSYVDLSRQVSSCIRRDLFRMSVSIGLCGCIRHV